MARFWDDKDAHGNKLTDGRVCLVIEPEDPNLPAIRTYGRDREEVLDKIARTAETAQATINRLRTQASPDAAAPGSAETGTRRRLTAAEQAQATADLSNPAKSPQALKTLLNEVGIDVDKINLSNQAKSASAVAQEWERRHPDFPSDDRNQRLLMDRALLLAGGSLGKITADTLDSAYAYLLEYDMLFESPAPAAQPDGSPASRAPRTRSATSYRTNALRTAAPAARPSKPRYTRAELDALNSAELRRKIETEPGFLEWMNTELSGAPA